MHDDRAIKLQELKKRVTSGQYRADPVAIAGAILSRRWSIAIALQQTQPSLIASPEGRQASVRRVARNRARTQSLAA